MSCCKNNKLCKSEVVAEEVDVLKQAIASEIYTDDPETAEEAERLLAENRVQNP